MHFDFQVVADRPKTVDFGLVTGMIFRIRNRACAGYAIEIIADSPHIEGVSDTN